MLWITAHKELCVIDNVFFVLECETGPENIWGYVFIVSRGYKWSILITIVESIIRQLLLVKWVLLQNNALKKDNTILWIK